MKLRNNPDCPLCGDHRTIHKLIDYEQFCGIPQQAAEPEPGSPLNEWEIDARGLKAKLDRNEPVFILDVREPHEYQICSLPNSVLIPLGDLPKRVGELNSADDIVVHCKSGVRSAKAVNFLKTAGFSKLKNLKGGILAWSNDVDPTVPKY